MTVSKEALKTHEELFPGRVSTLKQTDPELIKYFDNFAFDEVLRHGSLDTRTRLMVQLASMIASQALGEYRVMVGAALTVGVTPVEVKEIVYQAVPYVGTAKVFDFLHTTNDVLVERGGRAAPARAVHHHVRDPYREGSAGPEADHRRRHRREPLRRCAEGPDAHPALPVGELLR
jgi:alkylhydroperoxidase/carboxymuconolactone decarboxylase family protein YurZ